MRHGILSIVACAGVIAALLGGCTQSVLVDTGSSTSDFASFFEAETSQHDVYLARAYWEGAGGRVAGGPSLRPGAAAARVLALKQRLIASGDLSSAHANGGQVYDPATVAAVQRFQARHGLSPDGIVGPRTLQAINSAGGSLNAALASQPHIVMVLDRRGDGVDLARDDYFVTVPSAAAREIALGLDTRDIETFPLLLPSGDNGTVGRLGHVVARNIDGAGFVREFEVRMAGSAAGPLQGLIFEETAQSTYVITQNGRSLASRHIATIEPAAGASSPPQDRAETRSGFFILGSRPDRDSDRDSRDRDRDDRDDDRDRDDSGSDNDAGDAGNAGNAGNSL